MIGRMECVSFFFNTIQPEYRYEVDGNPTGLCLTHWGRVTYICVGNLSLIGLGNGLSLGQRQTIIWANAGIVLIIRNKLQWNFRRNWYIFIQENVFENVVLGNGAHFVSASVVLLLMPREWNIFDNALVLPTIIGTSLNDMIKSWPLLVGH